MPGSLAEQKGVGAHERAKGRRRLQANLCQSLRRRGMWESGKSTYGQLGECHGEKVGAALKLQWINGDQSQTGIIEICGEFGAVLCFGRVVVIVEQTEHPWPVELTKFASETGAKEQAVMSGGCACGSGTTTNDQQIPRRRQREAFYSGLTGRKPGLTPRSHVKLGGFYMLLLIYRLK